MGTTVFISVPISQMMIFSTDALMSALNDKTRDLRRDWERGKIVCHITINTNVVSDIMSIYSLFTAPAIYKLLLVQYSHSRTPKAITV